MRRIAWFFALVVFVLCSRANAQGYSSSFSFSYRIDISVHATVTQAGLQFQGASSSR